MVSTWSLLTRAIIAKQTIMVYSPKKAKGIGISKKHTEFGGSKKSPLNSGCLHSIRL